MTPEEISEFLKLNFADLQPKSTWGETSFFVNPGNRFSNGAYFATLKEKNGENDRASKLDREGVFRLNFGPGKDQFKKLFGPTPERPPKGGIVAGSWDFSELDRLMPHPVYGWMGWLCILNPAQTTFDGLKPLLDAAYLKARNTIEKRMAAQ